MSSGKLRAIILRSRDFGEADRIVTLISEDEGILDAKVKGARKPKSKIGPACGQFSTVELSLFRGRSIDTVTEALQVKSSEKLETDIVRLSYANLIAEITFKMSEEKQPDKRAYTLVDGALDALRRGTKPETVASAFMMKRLYIDGMMPQLSSCASCRSKEDLGWFSAAVGGILCPACAAVAPEVRRFGPESRYMALELYKSTWEEVSAKRFEDEEAADDLLSALAAFFSYRGDIRLRSLETISMLKG